MLASFVSLIFLPLVAVTVTAAEVQCWAPDGKTLANNETVVPCNKLGIQQDGVYSSCCRLDGNADQRDYCTTTGLCLSTADGVLRREFCTDKTWKSPACVNVCTDPKNGGSANSSTELTACSDGTGTYCCGLNNLSCCGTDRAITIPTQASVVSEDTKPESSSSGPFKSATIGLAVVLALVFLVAAGAITWLMRENKSIKKQLSEKSLEINNQAPQAPASASLAPPSPYQQQQHDSYYPGSPKYPDSTGPGAPSPAFEVANHERTRYSELDASMAPPRSEMSSPVYNQFENNGMASPRSVDGVPHSHSPFMGHS